MIQALHWFTLSIWLLWFLVYWRGGARAISDIRKSAGTGSRLDTALMLAIALGSLVLAGCGVGVALDRLPGGSSLLTASLGVFLTTTGIFGTFYCRHALGAMWTAETSLQPGHQIVDSGPYGIVRHPIYSVVIVMVAGIALVFASWLAAISATVIILAYALKARFEDDFLAEQLPGYREYQTRIRSRLIPGIW
jgi:protein-S-isoprenylcysteine O-methyltransferase Ste14